MLLIMSGAYIGQELKSEFGSIPPSFLPLGNRRLYRHQLELFPNCQRRHLAIPEDYVVSKHDIDYLSAENVELIRLPTGLTLGAAIAAALALMDSPLESPLHLIFGDTLILDIDNTLTDVVATSTTDEVYDWAKISTKPNKLIESNERLDSGEEIVVGYFNISQPRLLLKTLTKSKWNFYEGINLYHAENPVRPVNVNKWLDFGHVNTFYHSKVNFTTQRAFNHLIITSDYVEKSSIKDIKIAAEAAWFDNVPMKIRGFLPQLLEVSATPSRYKLEYLHNTTLNELWVFGELSSFDWMKIFKSCFKFVEACGYCKPEEDVFSDSIEDLFPNKTTGRLNSLPKDKFDILKPLSVNGCRPITMLDLAQMAACYLPKGKQLGLLHGDFCFSNILYDFRTQKVKTIDPRGHALDGTATIWGDGRYDIAKLSHSVIGMYDYIISGYFNLTELDSSSYQFEILDNQKHALNQEYFIKQVSKLFGISYVEILAMQIHLFLSMLPLHADNYGRQKGLLANAYRLHALLIKEVK